MSAFKVKLGPGDGTNLRAEIRLDDLYDAPLADNESARQALGQEVIDAMIARAKSMGGKYSESYAKSLVFKAFGKSKGDVNLTQTGAMLSAIQVIESTPKRIVIGFEDELQSAKAHGHVTGNVGKKRDFFKVTTGELDKIASRYEERLTNDQRASDDAENAALNEILNALQGSGGLGSVLRRLI
jgi:hypothetical protein